MADQAAVRRGLPIFLQKAASKRAKSIVFDIMPTLMFLWALSGQKTGAEDLGLPMQVSSGSNASGAGFMISAMQGISKAQKAKIQNEREYRPLLRTGGNDVSQVKLMGDYDSLPDVPSWETNTLVQKMVQPVVRFARPSAPYSIPHSEKRTAISSGNGVEGAAARALGSLYDGTIRETQANLTTKLNNMLLGISDVDGSAVSSGNGLPADESVNQWSSIHSIKNALKNSTGTYCGIDRTLSTCPSIWRGIYTTSTVRDSFKNQINDTNITQGLAKKGGGIELIGVGSALWLKAKAEAEAERSLMWTNQVPEFAEFGTQREVVRIHTGNRPTYIFYEPNLPAGEAFFLDPKTWTIAVHPEYSWKITGPIDLTKYQAAPEERDVGTMTVEVMAVCEVPAFNRYYTDLG